MRKSLVLMFLVMVMSLMANSYDVNYTRVSSSEMKLDINVDSYTLSEVNADGQTFTRIDFDGGVRTNELGYAELPRFTKSVQLSNDKNVTLDFDASKYVEIKLDHPLLPSRGIMSRSMDISKIPYEIAKESITDSWYPGNIVEGTDPFIMRDVRGASVITHPFQYNAATQTLRVYKNISVTLTDNDTKPVNPLNTKSNTIVSEMNGMYKGMFLNYNETKVMDVGELGEILIVYTSSYGGLNALQPYIQWKEEMGYTVNTLEVPFNTDLYVSGDITDAYNANNNILSVQLVGDWAALKSEYLNSATDTWGSQDPMLGCVVGTDQYMDIIVGRFSAANETDVEIQINKAINYEKNPEIGGSWYDTAMGIAGDEGPGDDGEIDYEHANNIINGRLLPFTYTSANTVYQSLDSYTKTKIIEYTNTGASIINYTGHGSYDCWQSIDGGWIYNADIETMNNGNRLPFIQSVACLVGNLYYASSDCFAEVWLRHPTGGAVVGMFSTISQPWYPPMVGQDYFNDILIGGYDYSAHAGEEGVSLTEQRTHYGSIAVNASNQMLLDNPTDASTRDTQESWTIFGDVTVQVRTDQPILIDNASTTILIGNYSTTITAGGSPVEGARVTLYKDGVNVTGLTNSSGNVSLNHSFSPGDNVTLTVTGFNLETEQSVQMVSGDIGGTFGQSTTSLGYGSLDIGSSSTLQFTITNTHNSETLTGDITTIAGYTASVAAKGDVKDVKNVLVYGVGPNDSKTFDLKFEPGFAGTFNGNITITSTDTGHATEYIAVTGACVVPDIAVPADLATNAAPGNSVIKNFDIDNVDQGTLDYSIAINYTSGKDIKASGGPDTYGYKWKDSDEVGGPVYNWVEINGSGTPLGLADDGESAALNLGFTFNYYGVDYTTIVVASNGAASFTETDVTYTNASMPGSGETALLAPFWDDLNPASAGEVYYYADGTNNRFIIEWDGVVKYSATAPNTFQIILYESGKIVYQYADMQGDLTSCTVGIEDHSGSDGDLVIYNAAYLKDNLAVQFQATPEWLTLDKTSGTVAGSGTDAIAATCDAAELELGVYTADIIITSNDPDEPTKVIPVTFTVSNIVTPDAPANIVTSISGSDIVVDWDVAANATSYDVYSSDDPYGTFIFVTNVGTNQYTVAADQAKLFYYIVAKN
ncbi:MAG: C25 family cysteine peptidase [Candidatus Delongbacteria bacterium]|jgi:hypothetical protein|nr:C25 family cysteine peptidase [Candidatus Delongbacteria bacterium]